MEEEPPERLRCRNGIWKGRLGSPLVVSRKRPVLPVAAASCLAPRRMQSARAQLGRLPLRGSCALHPAGACQPAVGSEELCCGPVLSLPVRLESTMGGESSLLAVSPPTAHLCHLLAQEEGDDCTLGVHRRPHSALERSDLPVKQGLEAGRVRPEERLRPSRPCAEEN